MKLGIWPNGSGPGTPGGSSAAPGANPGPGPAVPAPGAAGAGAVRAGRERRLRPRSLSPPARAGPVPPALVALSPVPVSPVSVSPRSPGTLRPPPSPRAPRDLRAARRSDVTAARRPRHVAADGGNGRERRERGGTGLAPPGPHRDRTRHHQDRTGSRGAAPDRARPHREPRDCCNPGPGSPGLHQARVQPHWGGPRPFLAPPGPPRRPSVPHI